MPPCANQAAGKERPLRGETACRYNRGMNTLCFVIDRLHVGYLGAYGNTWTHTPTFDRLAAEGFTFDGAFLESPELTHLYEAYWLGRHAMGPPVADPSRNLPSLLSQRSVSTRLLTDDPTVARHRLASSFGQIVELHLPEPDSPAPTVEDTLFGQCFAQALEMLDSVREPSLLWCHFGALGRAWDAPRELRTMHWEAGDPEPPETVTVPSRMLPRDYDPDELLGCLQVYAAQVAVLDTCLGVVLDWLQSSPVGRDTVLAVVSARGFPLGEHLAVGPCCDALYPELVHVPMFLRFPDGLGASDRSPRLVQPSDFAPSLAECFGVSLEVPGVPTSLLPILRGENAGGHELAGVLGFESERTMVTPAWYLRQTSRPELFLRPDDRWAANDVADRCHEVVEAMEETLSQYEQTVCCGQTPCLSAQNPLIMRSE